jgi:shikimate dehydrogenase
MNMQLPTGASRFVFILAHPAGHVGASRHYSPYFWENGLDWPMVPLDVAPAHLAETIGTLARSDSVVGFNLTMPHKPAAFALGDAVGRAAEFEGAVTTIRIEAGGKLVGEPFDGGGFLNAARAEGVFDSERPCVVIGAGGAGAGDLPCTSRGRVEAPRHSHETAEPVATLASKLRGRFSELEISFDEKFEDAGPARQHDLARTARERCPADGSRKTIQRLRGIRYYRGAPDRINECGRRACP